MAHDPWIVLAAQRVRVWLRDGSEGVLVGAPKRKGHRARIEFADGRRRTVAMAEIAAVEQTLDGVA